MAASGAKFVVDFVAEMKQFKAALAEVEAANKKVTKTDQASTRQQHSIAKKMIGEERKERTKLERDKDVARKKEMVFHKQQDKLYKSRGGFMAGLTGRKPGQGMITPWTDPETGRKGLKPFAHSVGSSLRTAGGAAAGGLAMVGGFVASALLAGYEKFKQKELAVGRLAGYSAQGGDVRKNLSSLRGGRGGGGALGYSTLDIAEAYPAMARSTGQAGSPEMMQAMRATGMGGGEVGGVFDAMRQGGADFTPGTGKGASGRQSSALKSFSKMMAAATASGLKHEEIPKYLEGIAGNIQDLSGTVSEVNADAVSELTAALGRTGAGQRGAGGAALVGSINRGFTNPGGGEWGESFMRQAMGFGKPGGSTGFYQSERMRQQGINDPKNLGRVMDQATKMFPNKDQRSYNMSKMFNTSMEKWDKLEESQRGGNREAIKKATDEAKPIEEQALEAIKGLLSETKEAARAFDKGAAEGAKIAKTVHDIEHLEQDMLKQILQVLTDIFDLIKSALPPDPSKTAKDVDALLDENKGVGGTTPKQLREQAAKLRARATTIAKETVEGEYGTWQSLAKTVGGIPQGLRDKQMRETSKATSAASTRAKGLDTLAKLTEQYGYESAPKKIANQYMASIDKYNTKGIGSPDAATLQLHRQLSMKPNAKGVLVNQPLTTEGQQLEEKVEGKTASKRLHIVVEHHNPNGEVKTDDKPKITRKPH